MILEVGIIVASIPIGYALRKFPKVVGVTGHALTIIIYAMLFFIGISIGGNEDLLLRVADLGVQGIIVGVFSALGSVFFLCFLCRRFFPNLPRTKLHESLYGDNKEQ